MLVCFEKKNIFTKINIYIFFSQRIFFLCFSHEIENKTIGLSDDTSINFFQYRLFFILHYSGLSKAKVFSQVYNNIISYFLFLSLRFIFFVVLHYQISSKGILASEKRFFFLATWPIKNLGPKIDGSFLRT